jgi:DnaJ-domain-containing protein 1
MALDAGVERLVVDLAGRWSGVCRVTGGGVGHLCTQSLALTSTVFGLDVFQFVAGVPPWLVLGVSIAAVFTVIAAFVFAIAEFALDDVGRAHATDGGVSSDGRRHVSSEGRRRVEIREYLHAIDERFVEDTVVDGQRVAFYLPEHDVAVTFDAHAYFRLNAAGTTTVLCEHEMHGHHLGRRLPFEVPEIAFEEDAPPEDVVRAAFDALGVSPSADVDTVRSAYRERVKEAHPDHGGSEDAFKAIREAYATAEAHADPEVDVSETTQARSNAP